MKYTHILWDFNGTLMDDLQISISSVNDMLLKRGLKKTDLREYLENIETPIEKYYEKFFDMKKYPLEVLIKEYQEGYDKYLHLGKAAEGSLRLIDTLNKMGVCQVIISSFQKDKLKFLAEKIGVASKMKGIFGADGFMAESKVERGKRFVESERAEKERVVVIGDLSHDYEMAKEIGCDCILYSGGHESKERLLKNGVPVCENIKKLENLLFNSKIY